TTNPPWARRSRRGPPRTQPHWGVLSFRSEAREALAVKRRSFITMLGGAAAWPLAARAQQRAGRVRRIAWLGIGRADEPSPYVDSLRAGLRELGWIEGSNLTIGLFWATGRETMEAAARELLPSDPALILTH